MGARVAQTTRRAVVLDSDVLIAYTRGVEEARDAFDRIPHSRRLLSSVVAMELMYGCRDRSEMRRLRRFFDAAFARTVHVSEEISRRAFTLVQRHALAHRLSPSDALVAATALTTNAVLATGNVRDFRFISGLSLLPLTASD